MYCDAKDFMLELVQMKIRSNHFGATKFERCISNSPTKQMIRFSRADTSNF